MKIKSKFKALAGEYKDIAVIVGAGVPRWRKSFAEAIHESGDELRGVSRKLNLNTMRGKLLATTGVATVLALTGWSVASFGVATTAIQGLGVAGFGVKLLAQRLEYNRHTLSILPVSSFLISAQMALLGGWSYTAMGMVAGSRTFVMSTLDDDKESQRKRVLTAAGFYAVGLPAMLLLTLHSPWSLLNAVAMTGGTIADSMTSDAENGADNSHKSRVARLSGGLANAAYNVALPQSWAAFAFDVTIFFNRMSAIYKHDISSMDDYAQKSWPEKTKHYLNSLAHPKAEKPCSLPKNHTLAPKF